METPAGTDSSAHKTTPLKQENQCHFRLLPFPAAPIVNLFQFIKVLSCTLRVDVFLMALIKTQVEEKPPATAGLDDTAFELNVYFPCLRVIAI